MNVKQLLRDWSEEKTEINSSTFETPNQLSQFIIYAFNSLSEDEFEILIESLYEI